jgi:carboxylesterase type B
MAAWGENNPGFIKGAIMESNSVATLRTLEQGQEQYGCLLNATGCAQASDSLNCLRRVNATALQTTRCQFNPSFDNDLIRTPMLQAFDEGKYLKIPTIMGTCNDEGTKATPPLTNTTEQAFAFIRGQTSGTLTNDSLALINVSYLAAPQPVFPDAGPLWRQIANAHGDFRSHCITARLQNAMARDGLKTFNYRYAVLDPEQEELGFGAYHVVELNGVFGPNNTDGFPPKSYATTNAAIVPVTMAYWTSFIRSLDPNDRRLEGTPDWAPWAGPNGRQRLRFQTNNMGMESMNDTQAGRCEMFDPMLPAIESIMDRSTVVALNEPGEVNGTSWEGAGLEGQTVQVGVVAGATGLKTNHLWPMIVTSLVLGMVW